MKNFKIYQSSLGGIEAVKQGWSWPAFLLHWVNWIWCFYKKLNGWGVALLAYNIISYVATLEDYEGGLTIIFILGRLGLTIYLGVNGNDLVETSLISRGYQYVTMVQANNSDDAIRVYSTIAEEEPVPEPERTVVDAEPTIIEMSIDPISLNIESGSSSGKSIRVNTDTTIGRAQDNDIIFEEKTVSGHHAKIVVDGDRFMIKDLGSTNGTRVNGESVKQKHIESGDVVSISSIKIKVQ